MSRVHKFSGAAQVGRRKGRIKTKKQRMTAERGWLNEGKKREGGRKDRRERRRGKGSGEGVKKEESYSSTSKSEAGGKTD